VFGNGGGAAPAKIEGFTVTRDASDPCVVTLKWTRKPDAVGFNIRYGIQKDKLYQTYQVLGTDSITIRSLKADQKYCFTIDAFNENGVTKGENITEVK
jgi:hypothetical protein